MGPQVVGGPACTTSPFPPIPCWCPKAPPDEHWTRLLPPAEETDKLRGWTHREDWVEGASPRVETSRDKSTELTGGGEGSTPRDSQVTGFLPAASPVHLREGGRDWYPVVLCWPVKPHGEFKGRGPPPPFFHMFVVP